MAAVVPLEERLRTTLARPRLYAVLFAGFSGFALLIAGVGLFGLLSYSVGQRSRELARSVPRSAPGQETSWALSCGKASQSRLRGSCRD